MEVVVPLRITSTISSSFTWLSILKALFALCSKTKASVVASPMAMKIPIGSKKTFQSLPSPKYS